MRSITLNAESIAKLQQFELRVEILDDAGRSLGYFIPNAERKLYRTAVPPISEEELDRRAAQGGGRSLVEIMADLEGRA